jgi:hypothetical protein
VAGFPVALLYDRRVSPLRADEARLDFARIEDISERATFGMAPLPNEKRDDTLSYS